MEFGATADSRIEGQGVHTARSWAQGFGTAHGFSDSGAHPRQLADVDGDGRADIVGFSGRGV